jgi:sugar phosphate isomerase/epimerase
MNISQVAAQLYTVRDHCKTPDDIAATLQRVAGIGYQAVQASALGPIPEADLKQLCHDNGLTLCATHESLTAILDTPQATIERLQKLGCLHTAIGFPSGIDLGSREGVLDFARRFEAAAEQFVAAGLSVSHHNHQHEFRKIGGQTVMQILLENTVHVGFELDTYWVQFGGANPVTYCEMMASRMPLLHLKDYGIGADSQPHFAEIGQGNLEFEPIIAAAEAGGCGWFIVEQDTTPGDPFDSLQISFDYVKNNLCRA